MIENTVPDLALTEWGIRDCTVAADRFNEPGWSYEESLTVECPDGHAPLHVVRKPYERNGKTLRYTALICTDCQHAYEMRDLGYTSYPQLRRNSHPSDENPSVTGTDRAHAPTDARTSRPKHKPTEEQQRVIDAALQQRNMVVQAGAGAGKTSTLEMVGNALTGRKVAYIAYNRVTAGEARSRFPRHVRSSTSHGLARTHRERYQHRLDNTQRQRAHEQAQILGIGRCVELSSTLLLPRDLARIAMETVTRYCHSDHEEIGHHHIPHQTGIDERELAELADVVLPYAQLAWADIRNINGRLKFEHDFYFKMWALSKPRLPFDVIMLDEAQDTNPALAAVIAAQDAQQILVGDSNQQLYSWRGAVDALDTWEGDVIRLTLQQSWRFGQAIADEANRWLTVLGAELRLIGNPARNSTVGRVQHPDAILCRTNVEAVKQLMDILQTGRRPALAGGGDAIKNLAEAARQLKSGQRASHRELFAFKTWGEVQDYAENEDSGRDLKPFVDLIDEHGVETVLSTINSIATDETTADVVVSTAHKSKGREWDTVTVAEDYREPQPDDDGNPGPIPSADAMLAYVAVTRAKRRLDRTGLAWIDNYLPRRQASAPPARSSTSAIRSETPRATIHDQLPSSQELAAHLHQHAGPIIDRIESRDLSGNTGGYTVLVCEHPTYPLVTVVTTGLRFCTPSPDTEIAVTAYRNQVELARQLLEVTAMTALVQSYALVTGHRMFSQTPLVSGTNIYGIVADEHPYFGADFGTVRAPAGHQLIRLITLLPLVGDELDYIRKFGHIAMNTLWRIQDTRLADLTRHSSS
ncbi:UvrD-helicase domain-containing protein [Nocardia sp. CDC160]|uniref:UvrD-helicase domain-containing protein n=1 Tax=Nocardia sp. CDC160 TaxID=3112166 RepID=UPI002DB9A777|nr:UvrD-helicase domain-containing protein [Nocardia sp. CDC160]MEC3915969.1 UvrD-helicase domain-containing protein [Nocardia sp. CDC160]